MSLTERTSVESSNLHSIGYDPGAKTLAIQFWSGRGDNRTPGTVYHYFDVPQSVFDGLKAAKSKGEYFDREIKKAGYRYSKQ